MDSTLLSSAYGHVRSLCRMDIIWKAALSTGDVALGADSLGVLTLVYRV